KKADNLRFGDPDRNQVGRRSYCSIFAVEARLSSTSGSSRDFSKPERNSACRFRPILPVRPEPVSRQLLRSLCEASFDVRDCSISHVLYGSFDLIDNGRLDCEPQSSLRRGIFSRPDKWV